MLRGLTSKVILPFKTIDTASDSGKIHERNNQSVVVADRVVHCCRSKPLGIGQNSSGPARNALMKVDYSEPRVDVACIRACGLIMFSETWPDCEVDVFNVCGYKSYYLNRLEKMGGGIKRCERLSEFSCIGPL